VCAFLLQIEDFFDTLFRENEVASADSLDKAKALEHIP